MTADEKLAELLAKYPTWNIYHHCPGQGIYEDDRVYIAAPRSGGIDLALQTGSLAALAEALAKLEGVTIPRKLGTVQNIVAACLRATDHEGLCGYHCGCDLEYFMPCTEDCSACVPGHKVAVDPKESEWDRDWEMLPGPREHSLEPQNERGE